MPDDGLPDPFEDDEQHSGRQLGHGQLRSAEISSASAVSSPSVAVKDPFEHDLDDEDARISASRQQQQGQRRHNAILETDALLQRADRVGGTRQSNAVVGADPANDDHGGHTDSRLPPDSIMFQRSPSPASPYHSTAQVYSNQDLWPSEKAYPFPGSFSALESPLGHGQADADSSVNGDDAAYTGSPTYHASELPVASTSRVVTHSQPLQSQPWWVRESRRNASPAALKASIPRYSTASSSVNIASASNDADVDRQRPQREGAADAFASNYHTAVDVATDVFQAASDRLGMRRAPIRLKTTLSAREKALWTWTNVVNVDTFLQEVYTYYARKGFWSIAVSSVVDLLTVGFVIVFSSFLLGCIDYSVIRSSHKLSEVTVPKCMSRLHGSSLILVLAFASFYSERLIRFGSRFKRLWEMRQFYTELLEIPEADIQTVSWPAIVEKLAQLREDHPSNLPNSLYLDAAGEEHADIGRLDVHDVANRIMRKENYLIALFNKSILNLAIPAPQGIVDSRMAAALAALLGTTLTSVTDASSTTAQLPNLTRTLEWNLNQCLMGLVFADDGQIRPDLLQERNKSELCLKLQHRFVMMGCLNALLAPFIVIYLLFYSFFRYFEEYHKNPSSIGGRSYTQLARWKFREFNELPHTFQNRINRSYPLAEAYVSQFPNDFNTQIARFVAFIAGAFASVLVLFSLIDPDAFLHFEITQDRTVLFYITVFGSIVAVARGMVPDTHRVVDPAQLMKAVIEETHYLPAEWRNQLHSARVHREFGQLFTLRPVQFLREIASVITTPLVLWITLPRCAPAIVDFFRDFTVHVDGLGYVCSFAVFDFHRHGDVRFGAPVQGPEELISDQGKLEKSVLNFKAVNPHWQPADQATSLYLSRMSEAAAGGLADSVNDGEGLPDSLVPSTIGRGRRYRDPLASHDKAAFTQLDEPSESRRGSLTSSGSTPAGGVSLGPQQKSQHHQYHPHPTSPTSRHPTGNRRSHARPLGGMRGLQSRTIAEIAEEDEASVGDQAEAPLFRERV